MWLNGREFRSNWKEPTWTQDGRGVSSDLILASPNKASRTRFPSGAPSGFGAARETCRGCWIYVNPVVGHCHLLQLNGIIRYVILYFVMIIYDHLWSFMLACCSNTLTLGPYVTLTLTLCQLNFDFLNFLFVSPWLFTCVTLIFAFVTVGWGAWGVLKSPQNGPMCVLRKAI